MSAKQKRAAGMLCALTLLASSAGLFVSAQSPQEVGTWAPSGTVADARSGAAAVALGDGRTLIVGGVSGDAVTDSVLVYDPATTTLVVAGQLLSPRTGHTATLLDDGRVLVAGGLVAGTASADIEIFDPSSGTSTAAGQLAQARSGHAAARIADGIVVVFGGTSSDGTVLRSVERVDAETGDVTAGSQPMLQARTRASATTLIHGLVLVAGGNSGTADLSSAELYDPVAQSFQETTTALSTPRSSHTAVLLPHNGGVLIAGGSTNGVAQPTVDLFVPAQFPDPFSFGMGAFAAADPMESARAGAVAGPGRDGYVWVDGGGPAAAESYRFATIKTDKDDYAPGQRAVITGSGWLPNAEVRLVFQEDPPVHDDYVLTVTADAAGNILWDQWAPEEHDLNVRFYLLASDSRSRAQMTFTDRNPQTITVGEQTPDPVTAGNPAQYTVSLLFGGNTAPCTVTLNVTGLPTGTSFSFSPDNQPSAAGPAGTTSVNRTLTITTTGAGPNTTPATPPDHVFTVSGTNGAGCQGPGPTAGIGTLRVAPANTAPTVAFATGDTSVDESDVTPRVYTYTISDPNAGDTVGAVTTDCGANGVKVPGSDTNDNDGGSFACTFPDGPASSAVTVQATDNHGASSNTATRTVTIANVAPTVALNGDATASEGDTKVYTYTVTDPGDDPNPTITESCGSNGTRTDTPTANHFECTFPDGPASSTVTVAADDGDVSNNTGTGTVTVAVANVAPAVTFTSGPTVVDESGVTEHTYSYTISDPGTDTVTAVNTACGANGTKVSGSDANDSTTGSFRCTFPDGPATSTVTAQATDSDGDAGANGERTVTVNNVAPTVTFTAAPASANESSATEHTYTYSITDPGVDTIDAASTSCGTHGAKVPGSDSRTNTSGTFRCRFDDGPATSAVTAQATDSDGSSGNIASQSVTVANVAPTAALTNSGPVGEGSAATIQFTGQSDPSQTDTTAGFRYSFSCLNNAAVLATSWAAGGTGASVPCTFGDNGSYIVLARILDKDSGYTDYATTVAVTNVGPALSSPAFTFNPFTGTATAGINVSDAGWLDVVSSSFTWAGTANAGTPASHGPGAAPGPLVGTFASSHTFPVGCVSGAISVSVSDDDGGVASQVLAAAGTLDVYSVAFLAPLRDGARNVVRLGNVVPVKLSIRDCTGAPVTGRTLSIWVAAGIIDYEDVENGTAELLATTSVSSADTNGLMRFVDSHYMYNLATSNLATNLPYTIVIKEGSLVVATAVIEPKK